MTGVDDALTLACQREYPRLVGLIALHVGDRYVAEELAQDALVQLCRRWPRVDDPAAWLTRVALNLGVSWLRRRAAEHRANRRHGTGQQEMLSPDLADVVAVHRAVAGLPSRQRTVVALRYYEDLSVAETARLMGCAEGTVKALTFKALRSLEGSGRVTVEEALGHA